MDRVNSIVTWKINSSQTAICLLNIKISKEKGNAYEQSPNMSMKVLVNNEPIIPKIFLVPPSGSKKFPHPGSKVP